MKNALEDKYIIRWVMGALILFALLVSVIFFQKQSLRLDEAQSLWQTSRSPMKIFEIIGQDVHVPLYHMLLHGWQLLFGNGVIHARLFSLIFFLISIPLMYAVGTRIYNSRVGLYAAILLTISPFMNWYGNEIRMYSLFVFLSLLNTYFFVGIFKKKDIERSWIGFTLSALLGIYCHYFFFLILITDALFYFLHRRLFSPGDLKKFATVASILFVAFLPWMFNVYRLGSAGNTQPSLETPTSINVFNTLSQFVFGFQTDHLNTIILSLWPLTILLGFLALRKNRNITPESVYVLLIFIVPNILAFIISFARPVYLSRYLIFTLPPLYLFLSGLLDRYSPPVARVAKYGLVGIMLIMLVYEGINAASPVKENYREAAQYLEAEAGFSDIIVVSAPFTVYPMVYYYRGPLSIKTLPLWDQNVSGPIPPYDEAKLAQDLEMLKGNHAYMWVLLSYDQGYEEKLRIYLDTHLERVAEMNFSPNMNLYRYKLRYE
jgi:mannosyltransferase